MRTAVVITVLGVLTLTPPQASAQDSLDVTKFTRCEDCIDRTSIVQLGTADPPGVVRHEASRIIFDDVNRRYAMWVRSYPEIALFSEDGEFLELVAPPGQGPGEATGVTAARFHEGVLWVFDTGNRRLTSFLPNSDSVGTYPSPILNALDFEVFGDRAVFAALGQDGYPLHVLSLEEPGAFTSIGPPPDMRLPPVAWSRQMRLARGHNQSIWWAQRARLRFEEWSIDGTRLQVIGGTPDWFPPVLEISDGPPASSVRDVIVDRDGRIWVLSRVADDDWRQGRDGAGRIIDRNVYSDLRLDVFDPSDRTWAGPIVFDEPLAELFIRDGAAHLSRTIYDETFVPRIEVSRLSVR